MKKSDKIMSLIVIAIISLVAYYFLNPFSWTINGSGAVYVCTGNPLTTGGGCGGTQLSNTQAAGISNQYVLGFNIGSEGPVLNGSLNVFFCKLGSIFVNKSNDCALVAGVLQGYTIYMYNQGQVFGLYSLIALLVFVVSILFLAKTLLEDKKK